MTFEEMLDTQAKKNVKNKKVYSHREHDMQVECVKWFRLAHRKLDGRLFAVPNGGRRDTATRKSLNDEGVVAGVSDLILLKSNRHYGALLIEMKTAEGRQRDVQKWWQNAVCSENEYKYVICRSVDDFVREVTEYLNDY